MGIFSLLAYEQHQPFHANGKTNARNIRAAKVFYQSVIASAGPYCALSAQGV